MGLSPEIARIADELVAGGHYRDREDALTVAITQLHAFETERAALRASIIAAKEEGDRDGYLTMSEVETRVRATIARKLAARKVAARTRA